MNRPIYYIQLAVLDLWRLLRTILPQVVVVAGICLPILLLQGMKRGHIADLRRALLTSATGRQLQFFSAQQGELLPRSSLDALMHELKGVELMFPELTHQVALAVPPAERREAKEVNVTVFSTSAGDPVLKLVNCDVLQPGERGIVLDRDLAQVLNVAVGGTVTLKAKRKNSVRPAEVELQVRGIHESAPAGRKQACLDAVVQDWIEQYLRGYYVPELGWPADDQFARDEYSGYLLFCKPGDDLRPDDRVYFKERGLEADKVVEEDRRILYGLLKPHDLSVYFVHSPRSHLEPNRRLTINPRELIDFTAPDDTILPWNEPTILQVGGESRRIVGCTIFRDSWLERYLGDRNWVFDGDEDRLCIKLPGAFAGTDRILTLTAPTPKGPIAVPLKDVSLPEDLLSRAASGVASASAPGAPLLLPLMTMPGRLSRSAPTVVSVELLAHLDAASHGTAQYDPILRKFVPVAAELMYDRIRLFADTVDEVPSVVEQLHARNYAVVSESTRIREIHKQDSSLVFIVLIVSVGVLLFGVFTVATVLQDSTARKRGMIGILRVMGVSKSGIFALVFLRAAVIGIAAGALAVLVGLLLTWLLRLVPVSIVLGSIDLAVVFLSALVCCVLGSLYPAWDASRVDPYQAIVEGKFREESVPKG